MKLKYYCFLFLLSVLTTLSLNAMQESKQPFTRQDALQVALRYAQQQGRPEVIPWLLAQGLVLRPEANISPRPTRQIPARVLPKPPKINHGNSSLHIAARSGQTSAALDMIAQGADLEARNDKGQTPLLCALEQNDRNTALLLLQQGANPEALDKLGKGPLFYAVEQDNAAMITDLISEGTNPHTLTRGGSNVLHYAAHHGACEAGTAILEMGIIDPNTKNNYGHTPLQVAKHKRRDEFVDMLNYSSNR